MPAFITSLRGIVGVSFELRTLEKAVHSGSYGGVFPDARTAMIRLLGTLHDEAGNVAIPGLVSEEVGGIDVPEALAREPRRHGGRLGADRHGDHPVPDLDPARGVDPLR